jgi:hypothetical protein
MNYFHDESVANAESQGRYSGNLQCRIVYHSAISVLHIRIRYWYAVPLRNRHIVNPCRKHGGEAPYILDVRDV